NTHYALDSSERLVCCFRWRGCTDAAATCLRRATMSISFPRIVALAVFLAAASTAGCHPAAKPRETKANEVIVTTPITGEVPDYEDFTGRLDALKTVDVRPRVSGYVDEAPFKEGDIVHEGDLLFLIDPRTYKADLELAEANLRQAEAERNFQIKK